MPVMRWEEIVGINVRRLRYAQKLTQEKLAAASGIDTRYLGGIERGQENPSVAVLGRIAEALDVQPADLLQAPTKAKKVARQSKG